MGPLSTYFCVRRFSGGGGGCSLVGGTRAGTRPAPTVLCLGAKGGRKAGPDL